ncbi:MAG: GNAT family N-acetyltransferase [Bacteroidaceae bacterium]|nr:GNAT family N-acetyltransferase [Bacteroidaceae bacterium]
MEQNSNIKEQCRLLWKAVFGDSDEFITQFMARYFNHEGMLFIEQDTKLQSMLHLVPFELDGMPVAYMYAVATAAEARGKGYATKLIKQAVKKAKAEGYKAIATLPADEELHGFYARLGFCGKYRTTFVTPDGFDFGTGESEKDFTAMLALDDSFMVGEKDITLIYEKRG